MDITQKTRLGWVMAILISWCINPVYGIEKDLEFRTITVREGLSHNRVKSLFKDSRGFMWVGTYNGLDRFDGVDLVTCPQLANQIVFALCETDSIFLWIGTDQGLMRLDRKHETCEKVPLGDESLSVKSLCRVGSKLLAATSRGLFIVDKGRVEKVYFHSNVLNPVNSMSQIILAAETDCWITTDCGLVNFDIESRTFRVYTYSSAEHDMNCMVCETMLDNKIYIGTKSRGMLVFDTMRHTFARFPDIGSAYVTTLAPAGQGTLYVGTDGGGVKEVAVADGKVLATISHSAARGSISSNAIYAFLYDGETYWIGTFLGGLNYTPTHGNLFSVYASPGLFNSGDYNIRSFYLCENGNKVIGTRDGLFYVSEKRGVVKHFSSSSSILRSNIIFAVCPLGDDYVIGTLEGIYKLDMQTLSLSFFMDEECFRKEIFSTVVAGRDGTLWLGSSCGLFVYNPHTGKYLHYDQTNSVLSNPSIHTIMIDSKDRVWISNANSVYIYDISSHRFISESFFPEELRHLKDVRVIYEDKRHDVWLCTEKNGVFRMGEHFTRLEKMEVGNFFKDNLVVGMIENEEGLWMSSQRGLLCYDASSGGYRLFSLYDGIPGYIFNYSVQEAADGTLWWGNESGLTCYNGRKHAAGQEVDRNIAPVITQVFVSGRTLHAGSSPMKEASPFLGEIELPSSQGNIGFSFSSLNYSAEGADIYEYWLEGRDAGWNQLTQGNKVAYDDLPVGDYLFRVRSSFNPNAEAAVRVRVTRSLSYWLYVCLACGVGCVLLSVVYFSLIHRFRSSKEVKENDVSPQKYANSKIGDERIEYIKKRLCDYMVEEKPYLNQKLKRQDVSAKIDCTPDELSQVLNLYLNMNFTDFINQYRVKEFILKLQDPSVSRYTLVSLGEQCGFHSKTSFFRSFKKIMGQTPSEYIKERNIEREN